MTKGTALETVTTGEDGKASYSVDLPISNGYYVSETQAPYAYIRNSKDVYSFNFNVLPETQAKASFSHTFVNDRTTAKIHIYKVDKESGKAAAQGDASLEGAVYGLYARNDIVHPDGATGVVFKTGDLVATLTTDKNGEAEVNNLYLGNYYVKEITPSEGYLLDEEEHDVVCDYEEDLVAEVSRSTTSAEQVIKQPFQLIKVSDNGDDTEAGLLAGAEFTAYLKSSLPVKEDGSYDFDKATPVIIGENGATTITSDDKGHAVSIAIPYGTYVVVESKTPHNMKTIKPFEVKIKENHPTEPQTWRVFLDREFTAKLRVIKKDSDTKQTVLVPNAEFKIFNLDKNEYVTQYTTYPSKVKHTSFFTDEDGDLILPEALKIGNYRIEEVKAPFGYVVNDNYINISVDTDTAFETDGDTNDAIITVEYSDAPAVGELTVEKKGEVLDGFKGGLFANSEDKEFVYKEGSLAGAVFKVYAAEDIFTADNQKDADGNRTKYYSKGDLVATLTTGKDGKATAKNLPLGQYRVVEVEAPYGYVLNPNEQKVTFTYVDDKTPVIKEKHNVRYIAITDGVDSLTRQEMDITPFKNILNDMYSRDISKKVLAGRMTRSRQGKFCGGQPPLGLMRDPEDKGHLILDPETAPVIRKIYDMALDGWGCMRIAKQLMDDKVPITRVKSNTECDVNYYSWGSARISHILRNPFYKGAHLVCRTHQKGIRSNTYDIIPREDWEIIEDCHEAIISPEEWEQVREIIDRRPTIMKGNSCPFYNLFHGIIYCATCGKSMQVRYEKVGRTGKNRFTGEIREPIDKAYYIC